MLSRNEVFFLHHGGTIWLIGMALVGFAIAAWRGLRATKPADLTNELLYAGSVALIWPLLLWLGFAVARWWRVRPEKPKEAAAPPDDFVTCPRCNERHTYR